MTTNTNSNINIGDSSYGVEIEDIKDKKPPKSKKKIAIII